MNPENSLHSCHHLRLLFLLPLRKGHDFSIKKKKKNPPGFEVY